MHLVYSSLPASELDKAMDSGTPVFFTCLTLKWAIFAKKLTLVFKQTSRIIR